MIKIICIICLFLCSCHSYSDTGLVVWNYDDFIKREMKMSDIADEMTIIQPGSIDYKGARIVHASSFFLAGTKQGVLRYDKEGHLMNRIGAIGQGPGEYRRFYNMAINETDRIIYVYFKGCLDSSIRYLPYSVFSSFCPSSSNCPDEIHPCRQAISSIQLT